MTIDSIGVRNVSLVVGVYEVIIENRTTFSACAHRVTPVDDVSSVPNRLLSHLINSYMLISRLLEKEEQVH